MGEAGTQVGCGTVWGMEMSTGSSPFLPAQWKGKEADQELRAVGAGQVLGTAHMAPAFQGLRTPSRRQWTRPSSEVCFLKVGQEPECQRIPQEGSCQLPGRYPCGTRFGGISTHPSCLSPLLLPPGAWIPSLAVLTWEGWRENGEGARVGLGSQEEGESNQNGEGKLTMCLHFHARSLICFHKGLSW